MDVVGFVRVVESLGEYVGSMKKLSRELQARGYKVDKGGLSNGFKGLTVRLS